VAILWLGLELHQRRFRSPRRHLTSRERGFLIDLGHPPREVAADTRAWASTPPPEPRSLAAPVCSPRSRSVEPAAVRQPEACVEEGERRVLPAGEEGAIVTARGDVDQRGSPRRGPGQRDHALAERVVAARRDPDRDAAGAVAWVITSSAAKRMGERVPDDTVAAGRVGLSRPPRGVGSERRRRSATERAPVSRSTVRLPGSTPCSTSSNPATALPSAPPVPHARTRRPAPPPSGPPRRRRSGRPRTGRGARARPNASTVADINSIPATEPAAVRRLGAARSSASSASIRPRRSRGTWMLQVADIAT
jgi:hypothetical protein